ncbi:MAG: divergent polysaccharide deacetylase family protein [Candidatus Omnitrophica bacterium]|nr:divergent polysaccharide deacetylase family protein [Candidatus Omnitrophota bacterium]
MAIILDDWGNKYSLVNEVIALKRPVTLAVLPHLPQSKRVAEAAYAAGLGIMLHMPMEPFDHYQPMEPRTLLASSSDEEIKRLLEEAFKAVPHAEGMNNHMGSAVTANRRVMETVMIYLKNKNHFFVDSNVSAKTVGWRAAKAMGLPHARRDVFIDNELQSESIKAALWQAQKIALKKGRVVVIGHDKRLTVRAIRDMIPEIEKAGIKLVLVKELLE